MKIPARFGMFVVLSWGAACAVAESRPNRPGKGAKGDLKMDLQTIATLVEKNELSELSWPMGQARKTLEAIPDAQAQLKMLGADAARPWETRFKAYEAFFSLGGKLADEQERRQAARLYADAIANAPLHNPFELPETIKSGLASKNLLALGAEVVIPALRPLLKNPRPLVYEGSEEPTLARLRKYRVADLAGALISALLHRPFPAAATTVKERDEALQRLE